MNWKKLLVIGGMMSLLSGCTIVFENFPPKNEAEDPSIESGLISIYPIGESHSGDEAEIKFIRPIAPVGLQDVISDAVTFNEGILGDPDLDINKTAAGDVILFGQDDIPSGDGKALWVYRKSAGGDKYWKLYMDAAGYGQLKSSNHIAMGSGSGFGVYLTPGGSGHVYLHINAGGDIICFSGATSGENPLFQILGHCTAKDDGSPAGGEFNFDDSDDYFHLDNTDTEVLGFKIDMDLIVGDTITAVTGLVIPSGASPPATSTLGALFLDTDAGGADGTLLIWTDGAWDTVRDLNI